MWRGVFGRLSPAGAGGRLSALIFHRVVPQRDPLFPGEVDAAEFDAICSWVRDWFQVLPLDAAVERLARGDLPARALAITFDDGYRDNREVALPILQRHGLTATFFVSTGFLDGGRMWNDTVIEAVRGSPKAVLDLSGLGGGHLGEVALGAPGDWATRRAALGSILPVAKYLAPAARADFVAGLAERAGAALPGDLMMASTQVTELHRAGMQIGAHTVNHPILTRLAEAAVRDEMASSKATLEALTGAPVTLFAYPNGQPGQDYAEREVAAARAVGFRAAMSTTWGAARSGADLFQLPRFTPWDRSRWRFGLRMARMLAA